MKVILKQEEVVIPEGLDIKVKSRIITLKGERGELTKSFKHAGVNILYFKDTRTVKVEMWMSKRKQAALLKTIATHIKNMITGILKGYKYTLKAACEHFPISFVIANDNKSVMVRNFLGEKNDRKINMHEGVTIKKKSDDIKDEVVIAGNDIEKVGLSCALLHQCVLVKRKDIRKFLDGIYITEKAHIVQEE